MSPNKTQGFSEFIYVFKQNKKQQRVSSPTQSINKRLKRGFYILYIISLKITCNENFCYNSKYIITIKIMNKH